MVGMENKKLRIAVVVHHFDPDSDGVSISAHRLISHLSDRFEVHLIAGAFASDQLDLIKSDFRTEKKGNFFLHSVFVAPDDGSSQYEWGLDNLFFAISSLHRKYSFDLIHAYFLVPTGYVSVLAGKILKIPVLVSVRGSDVARNVFVATRFPWVLWTLQNADFLTFVNPELREIGNVIAPVLDKSAVIPNSGFMEHLPVKPRQRGKKISIGYVGDVHRKKGFVYLIEALSELKRFPFELQVTGRINAEEKKSYEKLLAKTGLSKRIRFFDPVPRKKIHEKYNDCDVLVVPSTREGCPNVVLDGMLFGKLIVSTRIPGVMQVLEDQTEGLLANPRDSESLRMVFEKVFADPKLIDRLGSAAMKRVRSFHPKQETKQYEEIYLRLTKNK
ncbi:MAG: glycosyltransferase family 4 protein [Candidatus Diapherotrites archaeon]|uniref:Glycosyltransferase family 4 protein n=1 Tax=Candidatus Iainarchaeum sp. TaxID=3101447 RepID=A0A8T4L5Y0_9ARCH|nr:glycosyltransferase family 4 protein [Candidatus Diapherotrites archaeon]